MICRILAQTTESRMRSTDLQEQITAYLMANGVRFTKKWNTVDWVTSRWTGREGGGAGAAQSPVSNNSETYFDPGYAQIINRDKQQVWRMWLAEAYADEVRRFFGQHVKEPPTLHDEALASERQSRHLTALGRRAVLGSARDDGGSRPATAGEAAAHLLWPAGDRQDLRRPRAGEAPDERRSQDLPSCSSTRLIRTRISSRATGPCQARTAACRSSS